MQQGCARKAKPPHLFLLTLLNNLWTLTDRLLLHSLWPDPHEPTTLPFPIP